MRKTLPPLTGCWVHSFHSYEKYRNVREAAESLGMTPSTFVRKRQKYTNNVD
ncbi:MAG: helix-turn-helix domain-containing protein [Clostridiaceae bacterium]